MTPPRAFRAKFRWSEATVERYESYSGLGLIVVTAFRFGPNHRHDLRLHRGLHLLRQLHESRATRRRSDARIRFQLPARRISHDRDLPDARRNADPGRLPGRPLRIKAHAPDRVALGCGR